jgi:hypothetical protein
MITPVATSMTIADTPIREWHEYLRCNVVGPRKDENNRKTNEKKHNQNTQRQRVLFSCPT